MEIAVTEGKKRLAKLEDAFEFSIRRSAEMQLDAYGSLKTIRDEKLYKQDGYKSFESYTQERWGMKANYANKCIIACEVFEKVGTFVPTFDQKRIASEGQLRELTHVPEENFEQVLAVAAELSDSDRIPASVLKQAREKVIGKPKAVLKKPVEKDQPESKEPPVRASGGGDHGLKPERVELARKLSLKALETLDRHLSLFDFYDDLEPKIESIRIQVEALR
jgi:hypothetical protein